MSLLDSLRDAKPADALPLIQSIGADYDALALAKERFGSKIALRNATVAVAKRAILAYKADDNFDDAERVAHLFDLRVSDVLDEAAKAESTPAPEPVVEAAKMYLTEGLKIKDALKLVRECSDVEALKDVLVGEPDTRAQIKREAQKRMDALTTPALPMGDGAPVAQVEGVETPAAEPAAEAPAEAVEAKPKKGRKKADPAPEAPAPEAKPAKPEDTRPEFLKRPVKAILVDVATSEDAAMLASMSEAETQSTSRKTVIAALSERCAYLALSPEERAAKDAPKVKAPKEPKAKKEKAPKAKRERSAGYGVFRGVIKEDKEGRTNVLDHYNPEADRTCPKCKYHYTSADAPEGESEDEGESTSVLGGIGLAFGPRTLEVGDVWIRTHQPQCRVCRRKAAAEARKAKAAGQPSKQTIARCIKEGRPIPEAKPPAPKPVNPKAPPKPKKQKAPKTDAPAAPEAETPAAA